jgi:hypothetical protein
MIGGRFRRNSGHHKSQPPCLLLTHHVTMPPTIDAVRNVQSPPQTSRAPRRWRAWPILIAGGAGAQPDHHLRKYRDPPFDFLLAKLVDLALNIQAYRCRKLIS